MARTTWVFGDTVSGRASCKGCGARITWATLTSGAKMCFEGELVALRTAEEPGSARPIWEVDLDDNHWANCPNADNFRRR